MALRKAVFVLAADGTRLMPTFNVKKVRKLLKSGKAKIAKYRPFFTIQLSYTPDDIDNQSTREIAVDTGSEHIGISAKSEKHEFVSRQYDNLPDEKEAHDAQKKIRRKRRNRKRHRAPRFDNRKRNKGWLPPSLEHKKDNHEYLVEEFLKVFPATLTWVEMGSFDTQALAAIEKDEPLPQGTDYQQGPKYKQDTLREAVFYRDNYTCLVCGKSAIKDHVCLKLHHLGFRDDDHSDRMGNLATVCEFCHTPGNHKEGGALWDFKPELKPLKDAAFMNSVRWIMFREIKQIAERYGADTRMTYGSVTKRERKDRNLPKSHAIDAYCIGKLHPKHRSHTEFYKKKRRCNRCLQTFHDARYIDARDDKEKLASKLGCNRDNRKHPRNWEKNERIFRGKKVKKGFVSIRRRNYEIRPGDPLLYTWNEEVDGVKTQKTKRIISAGVQHYGKYVTHKAPNTIPLSDVEPVKREDGTKIPIEPGNKCVYIGGRKRRNPLYLFIYSVDEKAKTVTVKWTYSVKAEQIKHLKTTGGWEQYTPDELYIYS